MANSEQKKRLRVANVIDNFEIEQWKDGSIITISAGTGTGKSYLIKNTLFSYAKEEGKKILMLIHRTNCVDQFKAEIKRDGKEKYIDIMTYQAIESRELYHCGLDMSQYKYIVCDEFHYFIGDAGFNKTTDISFENIMKQTHATRIFMSATGNSMKRYMNSVRKITTLDYEIPLDFSFIDTLTFYNKDDTLYAFAEEAIQKNHKTIFFIQSAKKAYELYKKYEKYAMFVCGKSDRHYSNVDVEKLNTMLTEEKFNELFLITTSCLDAGVNIIDKELKHIVIDIKDIGSLIQCMGRKRIQGDEKIHVHIKTISNQQLGGLETNTKKNIMMADYLRTHTTKQFFEKYHRDYDKSNIIYDEYTENDNFIKKVNELMYFKRKFDIVEYDIMKLWGKFRYCKYLANKFGFYDDETDRFCYRTIDEDNSLETYLESMVGNVMLKRADRKELIEKINLRGNGKLRKNYEALNIELATRNLDFRITSFETSKIIDGKKKKYKSAWRIECISFPFTADTEVDAVEVS